MVFGGWFFWGFWNLGIIVLFIYIVYRREKCMDLKLYFSENKVSIILKYIFIGKINKIYKLFLSRK